MQLLISLVSGFLGTLILIPLLAGIGSGLQFWKVLPERTVIVYTLFGKVIGERPARRASISLSCCLDRARFCCPGSENPTPSARRSSSRTCATSS